MIGGGNKFQILVPFEDINPEGQTYQVVRGSQHNRRYALFVDGIEPYSSEIIKMPQGFKRYERIRQHERDTKVKELTLLQRAFPESGLKAMPIWWDGNSLPDKEVAHRQSRQPGCPGTAPAPSFACTGDRMKALLACFNSPTIGVCDCCGEPIYDPVHQLARAIFAALPEIAVRNAQALYNEIVDHIEVAFGDLLVLADEFDAEGVATMN